MPARCFDRSTVGIVERSRGGDGRGVVDLADASGRERWSSRTCLTRGSHRPAPRRQESRVPRVEPLIESGPVRGILRVVSAYGASELTEDFVLAAHDDAVEWRCSSTGASWRRGCSSRELSTLLCYAVTTYEARPRSPCDRRTAPRSCQKLADVTVVDGSAGLLVDDGSTALMWSTGSIGVTVVRSTDLRGSRPQPAAGVLLPVRGHRPPRFTLRSDAACRSSVRLDAWRAGAGSLHRADSAPLESGTRGNAPTSTSSSRSQKP